MIEVKKVSVTESGAEVITPDNASIIRCSNCRKSLMTLYEKETSGKLTCKIIVQCPFCNDASFAKEIYGMMRYIPAAGVQLKNKVDEPNDVVRFLTGKAPK